MFKLLAKSLFGSSNERYVKSIRKIVNEINALEPQLQELSDDELRAVVQGVLPWNLASLFLSVIGLMVVIVGISFG